MGQIRSRPQIYITLHKSSVQSHRNQAEPQCCIPSLYWQTIRTNELMGRDLSTPVHECMPEQLEWLTANGRVHSQFLVLQTHQTHPLQTNSQIQSHSIILYPQRLCLCHTGTPLGAVKVKIRSIESTAETNQTSKPFTFLCLRRQSMVRCAQSSYQNTFQKAK